MQDIPQGPPHLSVGGTFPADAIGWLQLHVESLGVSLRHQEGNQGLGVKSGFVKL